MNKILLSLSLVALMPISSFAQVVALPDGCYVSFSAPTVCYSEPTGTQLVWQSVTDQNVLRPQYGPAMAVIIAEGARLQGDVNNLLDDNEKLRRRTKRLRRKVRTLRAR
jgi:hypothetical protein